MYNSKPAEGDLPTSRQLGRTTAIAAGIAIILLVGVVMPSEYGIDPTGVELSELLKRTLASGKSSRG